MHEEYREVNSEETSTARNLRAGDLGEAASSGPLFHSLVIPALETSEHEKSGPLTVEGDFPASKVVTSDGGVVVGDDVKLMFPPGAVDNPIYVDIALEDPAKYYGLIVQKDLGNDVMFASPLIRLQPKDQAFKKHVMLTTKLKIKKFLIEDIVILHGTENRDGKVTWHDVTHDSKIDDTNAEVIIELEHFSLVAMLLKLCWIRTKDILSRLNWLAFSYVISVLLNKHSVPEELALLFVSQEVYNEPFYREHEASALVQLKAEGFEELQVISTDSQEEMRIYNSESLHVSLWLGADYNLADSQQGITDFAVRSDVWWNAGEVIKLPLEGTKDVRFLCGKISVQGENGHTSKRHFSEKDLRGYIRKKLGVEGAIFNVMPFVPDEMKSRVLKSWKGEDKQLEIVLQYWRGDLVALKRDIENVIQGSPSYRVSQRGQMHIRNVRELATKISGLQCTNGGLTKYFAHRIQTLVKTVLRDCCIELEDSAEGIDRAASSTNHFDYLKIRRPIPEEIAGKYQAICSLSDECIIKAFPTVVPRFIQDRPIPEEIAGQCQVISFSDECIIKAFPTIVPHFIQHIKEIFVDQISLGQNGLRGLDEKKLQQSLSIIRKAREIISFPALLDEVCEILSQLCMKNRHIDPTAEIETWAEHLAILPMLNFLKRFFQHCKLDLRLHKRLLQFSGRLRAINSNRIDIDEPLMRDFSDISRSLIGFAKFDPSKLVRFELTGSKKYLVSCHRESISYEDHQDVFSQCFHIEKESEEALQLQATALVHIDGEIRKKGTFQSKIMLKASCEEAFERCLTHFTDVAAIKLKDKDSENLRVVLCSAQREKLLVVLAMLKQKLSQEMIDLRGSEVTHCPLTIRTATSKAAAVVSLRLVYKWGSESLGFESKDFVAFAGIHGVDVVTLEENLLAHHEKPSKRVRGKQQQVESMVATLNAVSKQQSQLPKEPPVCEEKQQENGMQIAINITTSGKTIMLDVDSSNSVEDVKKKIHRLEGYPPDQQRLVFLNKKLEDDHTLRDYDIPNGSTLNLVLSPWKVVHRKKGAC